MGNTSMVLSRWQNKVHNMDVNSNRFVSLIDLPKPGSMVISDHNFFKWINSRHIIFRRHNIRFPSLVFLLRKYFPILQHVSSRNITIFPTNREYYLNQHSFFNITLSSHTSIRIIKDGAKKGSQSFHSIFRNPDFHISEYGLHPKLVIQPWLKMSRNSPFEITSPFTNPLHTEHDKPHIPGKEMPSIGYMTVNLRSVPFYRSRDPSPDIGFTGRRSEIGMEWHDRVTAIGKTPTQSPFTTASTFPHPPHADHDKPHISGKDVPLVGHKSPDEEGMTRHRVPDSSIPILYYHTPSKAALDNLKKSVAGIEKTVAERESFIEKYTSGDPFTSHGESDIANKMNINLSHLTDQVYQMLERKIKIERERGGLYG